MLLLRVPRVGPQVGRLEGGFRLVLRGWNPLGSQRYMWELLVPGLRQGGGGGPRPGLQSDCHLVASPLWPSDSQTSYMRARAARKICGQQRVGCVFHDWACKVTVSLPCTLVEAVVSPPRFKEREMGLGPLAQEWRGPTVKERAG